MKKQNFWTFSFSVVMSVGLLLSSCSTTEGVEELASTSAKLGGSDKNTSGRVELCQEEPVRLGVAGNLYANSINLNRTETVRFYTNLVCDATEYTWTVDGQASRTTNVPSIDIEGGHFLWLPPDGCGGFNGKWESYNPFFNENNPCWNGVPIGRYTSSLELRVDNSNKVLMIPVIIENVEFCRDATQECSSPDPLVPGDHDEDDDDEEGPSDGSGDGDGSDNPGGPIDSDNPFWG